MGSGDGRVVVGRIYTNSDRQYGSVDVDELLFFNQALGEQQIRDLKKMMWTYLIVY